YECALSGSRFTRHEDFLAGCDLGVGLVDDGAAVVQRDGETTESKRGAVVGLAAGDSAHAFLAVGAIEAVERNQQRRKPTRPAPPRSAMLSPFSRKRVSAYR